MINIRENKIKIAMAGNVDSGKSTLIGVLKNNILDDGRGKARNNVLRVKHEKSSGRTSSISFNYLKYNDEEPIPKITDNGNEIKKILTLVDLAGHEKYLKTTMFGLTGMCVDYAVVVIGANMGVVGMTREHLGILLYLEIPFIIVITKTDICPPEIYKKTIKTIKSILKNQQINKLPIVLKQEKDKNKTLKNIKQYTNLMNTTDRIVNIINYFLV